MLEQAIQQIFHLKTNLVPALENRSDSAYTLTCSW